MWGRPWMPWVATGVRREVRKRGARAVQRGKRGGFTPQLLIRDAAIASGGRRGLGGAVVKSGGHGEEWKRSKQGF